MNLGNIIIIDGVSNSGKTTLCESLTKDEDNVLIEEVPLFIKNHKELFMGKELPGIPKNKEEEIANQRFLLEAELERVKLAYYIIKSGKNAILDRSFLSTVSVAYSLDDNNSFWGTYINSVKLLREYYHFINDLQLNECIKYIFLITDPNMVKKRNETREKSLSDDWISPKLMNMKNSFFVSQSNSCNTKLIDTTDLTLEEVLNRLLEVTKKRSR